MNPTRFRTILNDDLHLEVIKTIDESIYEERFGWQANRPVVEFIKDGLDNLLPFGRPFHVMVSMVEDHHEDFTGEVFESSVIDPFLRWFGQADFISAEHRKHFLREYSYTARKLLDRGNEREQFDYLTNEFCWCCLKVHRCLPMKRMRMYPRLAICMSDEMVRRLAEEFYGEN